MIIGAIVTLLPAHLKLLQTKAWAIANLQASLQQAGSDTDHN